MTNILPNNTYNSHSQSTEEAAELIRRLRQKEGSWVEWGNACATLQKAGYTSQQIFEETGFEPIQQNQVIVGSQVYTSLINANFQTKSPSSGRKCITQILETFLS